MDRKHLVIVGGGLGGISAAKQLKKVDLDSYLLLLTITTIFFQSLLYQVATDSPLRLEILLFQSGLFLVSSFFAWILWPVVHIFFPDSLTQSLSHIYRMDVALLHLQTLNSPHQRSLCWKLGLKTISYLSQNWARHEDKSGCHPKLGSRSYEIHWISG